LEVERGQKRTGIVSHDRMTSSQVIVVVLVLNCRVVAQEDSQIVLTMASIARYKEQQVVKARLSLKRARAGTK
jgi:hypothetical protein